MRKLDRLKKLLSMLTIIIFSLSSSIILAQECTPWNASFANRADITVGDIEVVTTNIFDHAKKKENKTIHHLINKIHIKTKASVIESQLLFATGDRFQYDKILETERNIRKQHYIKEIQITPIELCGNQVNIRVKTSDNWTFTPGLSFSRAGGNNRTGVEVQEHNLFGYGKSLSFKWKRDEKRTSKQFYYKDPQLFGSRKTLSVNLQDNSDGKGYGLDLSLPFYQQESKHAWGLSSKKLKQKVSIYQKGKVANKITEENQQHAAYYGWAAKSDDKLSRFKVGWTFDKTDYLASSKSSLVLPPSLKASYPWFEFNQQVEKYITKTNFKSMGRVEDISLGSSLTLGVAILRKDFGSSSNLLKLSMDYSKAYELNSNNLTSFNIKTDSYLGAGRRQGTSLSLNSEYAHFNEKGNDFFATGIIKASNNLTFDEQIVLGANTGLRGYPIAYQTGDKSVMLQAEKRIHFKSYPLNLMKLGAALFTDIGTAWGKENKPKILADAGIGLRLIPTRSSTGKVIHIDLSFPLVDRNKVDKMQLSIKTSTSF